jgi:hypothetical protein
VEIGRNGRFITAAEAACLVELAGKRENVENVEGEEGISISLRMRADSLTQALKKVVP